MAHKITESIDRDWPRARPVRRASHSVRCRRASETCHCTRCAQWERVTNEENRGGNIIKGRGRRCRRRRRRKGERKEHKRCLRYAGDERRERDKRKRRRKSCGSEKIFRGLCSGGEGVNTEYHDSNACILQRTRRMGTRQITAEE